MNESWEHMVNESSQKISHILWLHSHEMTRTEKYRETERLVIA